MEIPINISEKNYNVYYRYRKVTKEQKNFIKELIENLLNFFNSTINRKDDESERESIISNQLYEFPPTLDKDFLYLSCLYTLIEENNRRNNNNKKVLILVNGVDKINNLVKMASSINKYYYKKNIKEKINNNKFIPLRIIPFYSRKQLCYKYEELGKSNTYDMDTFCINLNKSSIDLKNKCPFYRSIIEKKIITNIDNNNNDVKYTFDCKDIDEQMNALYYSEMCPFYYYLNRIINKEFDIIICERDYFFNNKKNICIRKLIDFDKEENNNKYLLVFDEYNDIDDYLIKTYSCIIDEKLLHFSEYQLLKITKDLQTNQIKKNDIPHDKIIQVSPETEIIRYNLFYDMKNYEFNGTIKSKESLISWLQKLIVIFSDYLKEKKNVFSVYKYEYDFLDKYYLELEILEQIYKRLITLFNCMDYFQYDKIYHLLHFIFFICSLAKYKENYFVINLFDFVSGEKSQKAAEFLLLKPNKILENLRNDHYVLNLTGGIGQEKIIKDYYNFNKMYTYEDDNELSMYYKTNLYLANNANTTVTDISFHGEILKMLVGSIPDGIICYFGDYKILKEYVEKWTIKREQVFTHILNNKLIFIEENNSERLSNIIVNYKKAINTGRGAILFLTLNSNKGKYFDSLTGKYSRCILFIGFPEIKEMNNTNIYNLKRNYNKISSSSYNNEDIDNFESFKLFSSKITNKISDINDKTIMVILEDKKDKRFLLNQKYKNCYPKWLKKFIHPEKDDETNNINEKIKNIQEFLSLNNNN